MTKELKNYFEITFNDSPNPCIITENGKNSVVFMNFSMEKLLKEVHCFTKSEDFTFDQYKEVFVEHSPSDSPIGTSHYQETHVLCPSLNKNYRVNTTVLDLNGEKYNLSKFFVTSSYSSQMYTIDEAMTKSVEIFSNQLNFDDMTYAFLELLGEFYQCDQSYVAYFSNDHDKMTSQYQWSKENVKREVDILSSKLPLEKLLAWLDENAVNHIVEAVPNAPDKADAWKKLFKIFKVENFTLCLMVNDHNESIGAVGFSNKPDKPFDDRLLRAVTRFIQEGFTKAGMQEELKAIGETDFLTGFHSRPRYATEISKYQLFPPQHLGVVFININGLRKTNEYLGFAKGDELIKKTSDLLRAFFAEPFYRISGDEFICFCDDETEKLFLKKLNHLRNELKRTSDFPFAVGHAWGKGKVNVERLVAEADTVMYINKQEYYHSTHRVVGDEQDTVLGDLLTAISNEEFLVYLQPQMSLADGSVMGAEALIRRLDKKENKMIFPDEFIPIYEQKSIIRHVDIFVLNKVCQLQAQWEKQGKRIPISVNLSRVTLIEYDIVNTVAKICDNHGIPHDLIIIEITERIGLIENEVATTLIDEFRAKGFKISLDDFGCAYSNIVTLANISVDEVKIDKSLVDNLLENEKNQIIVQSMIGMCNRFQNTHTLAEGIEKAEQADLLREYGCSFVQGYLYSRPIPNEEFFEKYIHD
ncbi:MAG: GGDEF domain-containing phosphodiesterase [Eubacteriales bacterium]